MPFIEAAIADAKETEAVPEGAYDLRIISAELTESKAGNTMIVALVGIESADYPNASPLTEYLTLPGDEDLHRDMKLRNLARFLHAFSVPFEDNGFDTDDLPGATASGIRLSQETVDKDKDGNTRADPFVVNRAQWPRLPKEDAQPEKKVAKRRR